MGNSWWKVRFGETLEQAVRHEIKEEYDIEIEILEQFPAHDHLIPEEKQHWVATSFLTRIKPGKTPKIMEPEKYDEIGWFDVDALPSPLSIVTMMDVVRYTKKQH